MKRLVRLFLACFVGAAGLAVAGGAGLAYLWITYGRDLPDYRQLANYAPPTTTRVYGGDGRLLAEYAREKRIFVPIGAIPDQVKEAFVSAEDKNFYHHFGIDPVGIARTAVANIERLQSNRRPAGASTITQQVARNFLLTNEVSLTRKIKEAILAIRLEQAFSKDQILELYLNQIYLGARAYGVAAAALNYFDKPLDELTVGEAAFLGGLPQAPSRFDRKANLDAATARRNYVIGRMQEDGYITAKEAERARAEPLVIRGPGAIDAAQAPFFVEEVRRQLVQRYGEEGFYEGGLAVRTTLRADMQALADRALRRGLVDYDRRAGWHGAWARLDPATAGKGWAHQLGTLDPGYELADWRRAVVLQVGRKSARLGLDDGTQIGLKQDEVAWAQRGKGLATGDVVVVEPVRNAAGGTDWQLRQRPGIEGAVIALDPHTGRVFAMSGGFSYRQSSFNRATQAERQPGSAFKPFVYLAGLESGYTPSSILLDAPIQIEQGPGLPLWEPENFEKNFLGPTTMRIGLEHSRNLMTVHLAQAIGMPKIIDVAARFGIDKGLGPYLAYALGANEVTLIKLTAAYGMIVNGGKGIEPYLVERIQDRDGRTIMRHDQRPCVGCQLAAFTGAPPPGLPDTRTQVEDPRIAYQMVSMLEGVIQRGTATAAQVIDRPIAGKTGTTNDAKDGWFIGFSPDLVVGVFMGYDQPRSLGDRATGAKVALPVWIDIMRKALADQPATPFRTPPGLDIVRIDAATGETPGPDTKTVIAEAFLPGTEPVRQDEPPQTGAFFGLGGGTAAGGPPPPPSAPTVKGPGGGIY